METDVQNRCHECGKPKPAAPEDYRHGWSIQPNNVFYCVDCRFKHVTEPGTIVRCRIPNKIIRLMEASERTRNEIIREALLRYFNVEEI
jgi:hypothetical protein